MQRDVHALFEGSVVRYLTKNLLARGMRHPRVLLTQKKEKEHLHEKHSDYKNGERTAFIFFSQASAIM